MVLPIKEKISTFEDADLDIGYNYSFESFETRKQKSIYIFPFSLEFASPDNSSPFRIDEEDWRSISKSEKSQLFTIQTRISTLSEDAKFAYLYIQLSETCIRACFRECTCYIPEYYPASNVLDYLQNISYQYNQRNKQITIGHSYLFDKFETHEHSFFLPSLEIASPDHTILFCTEEEDWISIPKSGKSLVEKEFLRYTKERSVTNWTQWNKRLKTQLECGLSGYHEDTDMCYPVGGRLRPLKTLVFDVAFVNHNAIDTYDNIDELVNVDYTVESIVWEIDKKHFPTFEYTLKDISEIMHSIRMCNSTDKLESLWSQIGRMAKTVRVVFLSKFTQTEECILESVQKLFKSKNINQKSKARTLLDNLKEEYKTNPSFFLMTCNKDIINYFEQEKIHSQIIFLSDHFSRVKCSRNQITLQHTTVANILDKVDDLLECYFLRIFSQIIDTYIVDCKDDERATETVRFANAIYKRSGLPEFERPNFKIGKIPPVSKKVLMKTKHELLEIDQVHGCDEEGDVLIIDMKKTDCCTEEAVNMVKELLKKHGIEKYLIYFPKIERHARVEIQSGAACNINDQTGTLGAFILEASRDQQQEGKHVLYVLCAGHVVENHNNAFLETQEKHIGKVSGNYDWTDMDIAKVRVEEDILKYIDVRFQNEADEQMVAKLFENDPSDLEGHCVFLRGASTALGLGKISSSRYLSRDKKGILLNIVKRSGCSNYAERGDSGATVLFLDRKGTFLYAVGMHLSQLHRRGSQLVYQALFLKDGINNLMARDASSSLRLASSVKVESHIHFDKLAVVEITRKYIRGVKAFAASIKDTETICTNGKEVEHLPDNLTPDEIVEKAILFVQSILSDGLHTMLVIGTASIDKATIVRKNTANCSGMTHTEAIGYSCTHNDTQPHVLLNVDDGKISIYTSLSSQQPTNDDSFDVYNSIRSECLKELQKIYEIKQNDTRNDEIKNIEEQFERKLLTFNGDEDIGICALDSDNVCDTAGPIFALDSDNVCDTAGPIFALDSDNVCDTAGPVNEMKVPKAVVLCILKKVCKELENKVIDALKAHGITRNAIFHVYGVLTLCPKLHEILPNTLGGNVTKCICVMELPKRVLHEAGKRLKCKCAIGLKGMQKQSNYIPWKESDTE